MSKLLPEDATLIEDAFIAMVDRTVAQGHPIEAVFSKSTDGSGRAQAVLRVNGGTDPKDP